MKRHSLITTVVIFILVISTLCMAGIQKGSGGGSASETSYDPSASGLTSTNIQDAIDETVGLIGEANTQGIVWGTLPTLATTTGLGTKYLLWGDDGTSKKMTGENFLDWIATDGGFLGASALSDTSYGPGWDADTTHTATKNAVYDAIAGLSSVYQPLDSDLTIYAGITPSANMQTFLGSADFAAMRTNLSLVPGTNVQAYDADLAALAGISGQRGDILFYGASGWTRLAKGTENYILTQGANDPAWAAPPGGEGSTADGGEGAIQLSDGAGGFTSNAAFYHSGGILHVPEGGIEVAQSATQAGGWSGKELSGNGTNSMSEEVPDSIASNIKFKWIDGGPAQAHGIKAWGTVAEGISTQEWLYLDDTKGNGDTGYLWSADKTYDELALKLSLAGGTMTGTLAMGANNITMTGSLGATGARVTKGWFTDGEFTNMPTVGGTSLSSVAQTLTNKTISTGSVIPTVIGIACSDETTALTIGTAKATFRMPYAMTLTEVRASVGTAPVGSTLIVDINEGGSTIMTSNKLSIDASEKTSTTAASSAGITDSALADDAEITIDIDQVGSSTAGAGLKVWLIGTRTL